MSRRESAGRKIFLCGLASSDMCDTGRIRKHNCHRKCVWDLDIERTVAIGVVTRVNERDQRCIEASVVSVVLHVNECLMSRRQVPESDLSHFALRHGEAKRDLTVGWDHIRSVGLLDDQHVAIDHRISRSRVEVSRSSKTSSTRRGVALSILATGSDREVLLVLLRNVQSIPPSILVVFDGPRSFAESNVVEVANGRRSFEGRQKILRTRARKREVVGNFVADVPRSSTVLWHVDAVLLITEATIMNVDADRRHAVDTVGRERLRVTHRVLDVRTANAFVLIALDRLISSLPARRNPADNVSSARVLPSLFYLESNRSTVVSQDFDRHFRVRIVRVTGKVDLLRLHTELSGHG